MVRIVAASFFLIIVNPLFSQVLREIDSLKMVIRHLDQQKLTGEPVQAEIYFDALNELVNAYIVKGDYDTAIYYGTECERRAMEAGYAEGLGQAYTYVATAYEEQGEFEKSIAYYEKALAIFKSINLMAEQAEVYVGLGNTSRAQGNLEKAHSYYTLALRITKELNIEEGQLSIYGNLGNIDFLHKDYESALISFREVVRLAEKFENKTGMAIAFSNIGAIHAAQNNFDTAIVYFEKAIELKLVLGDIKSVALTKYNIGELYYLKEDYHAALPFYRDAYETFKSINSVKWLRTSRMGLFKCCFALSDFSSAEKYGLELLQMHRVAIDLNFPILSEKEKELYLEMIEKDMHAFYRNSLVLKKYNAQITAVVYNNVLFNKGILLKSSTAMKNAVLSGGDTLLIKNYERWIELKNAIAQAYASGKSIEVMEESADSLEKILIKGSDDISDFKRLQSVTWSDVKKQLAPHEAAIEFIHFEDDYDTTDIVVYAALVVTPECEYPQMVRLFESPALEKELGKFQGNNRSYINQLYGTLETPNEVLYQLIWKPIDSLLKNTEKVFVAPSGLLHKISLNALSPEKGEYLCDRYQLQTVSSTARVAFPSMFDLSDASDWLIYGGINYNAAADDKEIWSYLEGTWFESAAIDSLLRKKHYSTSYYHGTHATESSFKTGAPSSAIIHIATHGFFYPNPKDLQITVEETSSEGAEINFRGTSLGYSGFVQSENPLMRSGLVFAGANAVWSEEQIEGEDGVLTAQEVAHIDLRGTQLVVLSACETGLGDIKRSEGVYGLQRAFKMAGAKFIIMSLWQVPDKETAEFMQLFYQKLIKSKSVHRAFYETQLFMRKKYDPYYWAAFVLIE